MALGPQNGISDVTDMHVRHVRKALGPQNGISDVAEDYCEAAAAATPNQTVITV